MSTTIITTDDLREFKIDLLENIKKMLSNQSSSKLKKYLKSSEVMENLKISAGTLQTLRINGTLPYTKIGGIIFYNSEEIQEIMLSNRIHHKFE